MRLTRFERKILVAIIVVGFTPLIGALVLGNEMLSDAYGDVLSPEWHAELKRGVDAHRQHIVALREDAEHTTDAIAFDHRIQAAVAAADLDETRRQFREMLERYPHVGAIALRREGSAAVEVSEPARLDGEQYRLIEKERVLANVEGHPSVVVTVAAPNDALSDFQHAGEMEELFSRLRESKDYITNFYLAGYVGLLLSIIAIALGVGVVLTRRVTRRVVDLVEATKNVARGDLTVVVPSGVDDEIGDLTTSFNDMVSVMRSSRERIEYLQRIGAWQDFARRLAHEIKNPLTPIKLAAQEMCESYSGTDPAYRKKLSDALVIIDEEVATLRRLVSEFSDFARLPAAQLDVADLGDFLADVERGVSLVDDLGAADTPIELQCQRPTEPLAVKIDAMMLRRCVDNLVQNAKAAIRGATGSLVVIEARRSGTNAVLEVRDDGPGVPVRDRQRVFDPYYTTKAEGTGLGLAIVKKVVLEHGGEIQCDQASEGGALFRIALPLIENKD